MRMTLVEMDAPLYRDDMSIWLLIIRPGAGFNGPENSEATGRQAGFKYWAQWDVHTADLHPQFPITAHVRLFWTTFLRSVYCVCMSVSIKRLVGHISVTVCALNELRCLMQSTVFAKLPNLQNMQLHWSCILSPRNYIYMLNGFAKYSTFWRQFN